MGISCDIITILARILNSNTLLSNYFPVLFEFFTLSIIFSVKNINNVLFIGFQESA